MNITHEQEKKFDNTSDLSDFISKRKEFDKVYNLKTNSKPGHIPIADTLLQHNLMREELNEYFDASMGFDVVEIADAIGDMLYILLGIANRHGMLDKLPAIFDEIHKSNMSKLGSDGKPIYREDGKVMKGPNYFKPDIEKILNNEE